MTEKKRPYRTYQKRDRKSLGMRRISYFQRVMNNQQSQTEFFFLFLESQSNKFNIASKKRLVGLSNIVIYIILVRNNIAIISNSLLN